MQDTDLPKEVESTTPDFKTELAAKLQELVPEAIVDGKVDTQKLKELLDDDAADDSERFGLFWPGKKRAMRAAQEPTTATLKPAKDESKDWDTTENLFIEGDNLEVLKVLQKYYHNKIKMIYIDPPYNTGRDFVYPDNYKEGLASYLEFSNQVDSEGRKTSTNSDTDGRYHSNWLNMMYPRLKLARNLLTDDGLIFISIDDNEIGQLRKLCDEIFGEDNFVDNIIWKKRYGGGAKEKYLVSVHEYVLVYARNLNNIESLNVATSEEQAKQYYKLKDEYFDKKGPYRTHPLEAGKAMDARPNLVFDIPAPDGSLISPKRQWLWSKDRVTEAIKSGELDFTKDKDGNWSIATKQYLYDENGDIRKTKALSLIDNVYTQHGTNEMTEIFGNAKIFQYPKPTLFIKRLIEMAETGKDSIILDFFSGSGTTAHATMLLNAEDGGTRKHIQVQLPEPTEKNSDPHKAGYKTIAEISIDRIKRAGEKIKKDYSGKLDARQASLDTGFKVFKLSDSNFTKWRTDSATDKGSLQQHLLDIRESSNDAASEEDLLTEILLKQGISLTASIKHTDVEGLSTWIVGDNVVTAYLNEHTKPSLDQLRAIAAIEPAKFIILEDAFQGDDELKTNLVQICKSQKIELWTV